MIEKRFTDHDLSKSDEPSLDTHNQYEGTISTLVGMVQAAVVDSNSGAFTEGFDAYVWLKKWLNNPLPAVGGVLPIDLMSTPDGQVVIIETLGQALEGTYS